LRPWRRPIRPSGAASSPPISTEPSGRPGGDPARRRPQGRLLFISSIGADARRRRRPYHVAKAGVNALAKVLAKEVASAGVR